MKLMPQSSKIIGLSAPLLSLEHAKWLSLPDSDQRTVSEPVAVAQIHQLVAEEKQDVLQYPSKVA